MGNKIGLEISNERVKLAYAETQQEDINFIRSLNSVYLQGEFTYADMTVFEFECSLKQFLSYHTSENVSLLRQNYEKLLDIPRLPIKMNRETMNTIQTNSTLHEALMAILLRDFELEHCQRVETSIWALRMFTPSKDLFCFQNPFPLTDIRHFQKVSQFQKEYLKEFPQRFLLISLRNGLSSYVIENFQKQQKLNGCLLGEKTILGILKFKYGHLRPSDLINKNFSGGDMKMTELLVEDIYGMNVHNLGLPGELIASSMGKVAKMTSKQLGQLSEADVTRSLVVSLAINTASHVSLHLRQENLESAFVLADNLHHTHFYWLIQSVIKAFAPDKKVFFCDHAPYIACLGTTFSESQIND